MQRMKGLESGHFLPKFFFLLRLEFWSNFECKAGMTLEPRECLEGPGKGTLIYRVS